MEKSSKARFDLHAFLASANGGPGGLVGPALRSYQRSEIQGNRPS
jgi:hypothetical protein